MYKKYIKRFLDIVFSLVAIIVFLPIYVIIGLLVMIYLGRPIIYKSQRVGKDEKIFTLYKFRSMTNQKDINGKLLPDEIRLNKFGQILRSTSLDELPEIVNVLKGDMSIIGPRPLPEIYQNYYNETERLRHKVRPGLSGLAQVNGRNAISWEQKFAYDVQYINNITFMGDVKIFLKTIVKVIKKSDIGVAGIDLPKSFHEYRMHQFKEKI